MIFLINRKGFTLIELLAIIVIFIAILVIAFPAVSKYINDTVDDVYNLHEESMKTAASNLMSKCIEDNINGCVPDNGKSKTVYLHELVSKKYLTSLRDPNSDDNYCNEYNSYVIISNSDESIINLKYKVCLVCGDYKSSACE